MIRELAENDVSRYEAITAWPLGEALLAFESRARARAERQYQFEVLSWQLGGAGKRPERPEILKEER